MMTEFAQFLTEHATKKVGNKSLFGREKPIFVPGLYDESAKNTWTPSKQPAPISGNESAVAEERLGCTLPEGYKTFIQTLGPGLWADAGIPHPNSLYAFDEELGEMAGFISLAYNVDGCGNSIAFDGKRTDQQQIYFCDHDPFGYAVVAASFEDWIKLVTNQQLAKPNKMRAFYTSLSQFREISI